jgi:hypothetical protein
MQDPSNTKPMRKILEGVPRVSFYDGTRCPEDVPFPSCLRAYLEYVGDDNYGCTNQKVDSQCGITCTNAFLMATSGAAFRFLWKPGWFGDNSDIMVMAENPTEPIERAFASVGYGYEIIGKKDSVDNEAVFRARISASINAGRPVIAYGVIGPPEVCLVCGYDEGGEVLIGWNCFQDLPEFGGGGEKELCGYFRKRDWFANTPGLILFGDKQDVPDLTTTFRTTLQWALQVTRTPQVRGRPSGFAAYTAWAEQIQHNDEFPADDMAVLRERHMVHSDAIGTIAEGRWYGAVWLRNMAELFPKIADDLRAAAACFEMEHDLMWAIWEFGGGNGYSDDQVRAVADPTRRQRMVPMIKLAQEKDEQAAVHMERALAHLE